MMTIWKTFNYCKHCTFFLKCDMFSDCSQKRACLYDFVKLCFNCEIIESVIGDSHFYRQFVQQNFV